MLANYSFVFCAFVVSRSLFALPACSLTVPAARACSLTVPFIHLSVRTASDKMSGERNSSNVSLSSSNYNPDVAAAAEAQREQLLLLTSPPRQTAGPLQETTALHSALPARQLHFDPSSTSPPSKVKR